MPNNTSKLPRVQLRRYACDRCRDDGWVKEAVAESGFPPRMEMVRCSDCNPGVVLATRQEVLDLLMVCAVVIGMFAVWGGQ